MRGFVALKPLRVGGGLSSLLLLGLALPLTIKICEMIVEVKAVAIGINQNRRGIEVKKERKLKEVLVVCSTMSLLPNSRENPPCVVIASTRELVSTIKGVLEATNSRAEALNRDLKPLPELKLLKNN